MGCLGVLVVLLVSLWVGDRSCLANIPLQALVLDVVVLLDRLLSPRWYQTLLRKRLHLSEAHARPSPQYK